MTCYNENMTFTDSGGDDCEWYGIADNYRTCGNYDTADFKALSMCCACGAGSQTSTQYFMQCQDQNNDAKDNGGDGCDWYGIYDRRTTCGNYDDADFDAKAMCCDCGGGLDRPQKFFVELDINPSRIIDPTPSSTSIAIIEEHFGGW